MQWGVYQIYWGRRFEGALDRSLARLASTPDYVMFYRDLGRPFPTHAIDIIEKRGAAAIVSLELWHWHDRRADYLARINDGDYDAFFRRWAEDAKTHGRRLLLRYGFEFNGDWFSWAGQPKAFVSAWRRVHAIFDGVEADNVKWVWAANVTSHPATPENDMGWYYPGDDYVDWIAVDGYNWGDDYSEWHEWSSFESVFGDVLDRFERDCPQKPVMIAEFGSPEGAPGAKAAWIRDAHAAIRRRRQVHAAVWFNYNKEREGELDFSIASSDASLAAFNATFAADGTSDGED